MLDVRVLGPLEVCSGGRPVPLGARLERALLTILVLDAGRVVPADRIVDLLWRENPPPKALAALHTKIAHLRRALEPDRAPRGGSSVIVTASPGYRLERVGLGLDADRFAELVAQAGAQAGARPEPASAVALADEALALWRGPALGEFADEPFARAAAERLDNLRLAAVELRARALIDLGETERAVAELRTHVGEHPLREQARASMAHALYLCGQQAAALEALAEGRRLLRDELGLDPGPELRRLEQQILDHDSALVPARPARPVRRGPVLHGRDAETATLARRVDEAAAGSGSVVLLTGDAGIGKSALLEELRSDVEARGGTARWATCRDGASGPPFWPVLQVVRAAASDGDAAARDRLTHALGPLREFFPDLVPASAPASGGVDPAMVLVHLSAALESALETGGGSAVSLLVLDDVHLADPATLALVAALADRVPSARLVLAMSMRSGEAGDYPPLVDTLAGLARNPRALRLALAPLPDGAVADLVRSLDIREPGEDILADVVRRADGNPFFAVELARAATEGSPAGVPAPVLDVLRQRVQRLPVPGADLLAAAAVAGDACPADDLAAVTGVAVGDALTALEAAHRARLVVDAGDGRFAFPHALLAEALLSSMSSARVAVLHRAFGERLAERAGHRPEEASRVAAHHLAARSLDGGAAALPWLARAADHALSLSALTQMRDLQEQVLAVLDATPQALDPHRRLELRARGRIAYADVWALGHDSPSVREYIRLMQAWAPPDPPELDDMELLWMATVYQNQVGRIDLSEATLRRMREVAGALDDDTATYLYLDQASAMCWMAGRYAEGLPLLDRADEVVARGRVDLRRSLAFSPVTRLALVRALTLWHLGDHDGAREQADAALRASDSAGLAAAGFARRWALVLALMDGDPEWVRSLLALRLQGSAWERYRYPAAVVAFAEGWLRTTDGDPRGGLAAMREAHGRLVEQGLSGGRTVLLGLLAEATLGAGNAREAQALCEAGLAIAERGERYWVPALERVRDAARQQGASPPQAPTPRIAP